MPGSLAGLQAAGLPEAAIQLVPTTDRAAVGEMLTMTRYIDVIVPRGGKGLVGRVQAEARVPVFAHLEGIVHVYVDRAADLAKARAVILNAKTRRTGICGAAECLLIDRAFFEAEGAPFVADLVEAGVEVRGDDDLLALPGVVPAGEDDWGREFLDMIIAARLVDGVDGAIAHIRALRIAAHRLHPDRGRRRGGAVLRAARQRDPDAQRLDPVRRRGRVRHGGGDRHRHRQAARARPGRGRAADELQVPGGRGRDDFAPKMVACTRASHRSLRRSTEGYNATSCSAVSRARSEPGRSRCARSSSGCRSRPRRRCRRRPRRRSA